MYDIFAKPVPGSEGGRAPGSRPARIPARIRAARAGYGGNRA